MKFFNATLSDSFCSSWWFFESHDSSMTVNRKICIKNNLTPSLTQCNFDSRTVHSSITRAEVGFIDSFEFFRTNIDFSEYFPIDRAQKFKARHFTSKSISKSYQWYPVTNIIFYFHFSMHWSGQWPNKRKNVDLKFVLYLTEKFLPTKTHLHGSSQNIARNITRNGVEISKIHQSLERLWNFIPANLNFHHWCSPKFITWNILPAKRRVQIFQTFQQSFCHYSLSFPGCNC